MNKYKKNILYNILFLFIVVLFQTTVTNANNSPVAIASKEEWEILKAVNRERAKVFKKPLSMTIKLQNCSDVRSREIIKKFSHTRPNGKKWYTVLKVNKGYYDKCGENIANGQTTVQQVMKEWMKSKTHKKNILDSNYTHLGVGHSKGVKGYRNYYSQFFLGSCRPESIRVMHNNITISYPLNTSVVKMNRVLVLKCKHGTSYMPLTANFCKGFRSHIPGKYKIQVSFQGKKTSFYVKFRK